MLKLSGRKEDLIQSRQNVKGQSYARNLIWDNGV